MHTFNEWNHFQSISRSPKVLFTPISLLLNNNTKHKRPHTLNTAAIDRNGPNTFFLIMDA